MNSIHFSPQDYSQLQSYLQLLERACQGALIRCERRYELVEEDEAGRGVPRCWQLKRNAAGSCLALARAQCGRAVGVVLRAVAKDIVRAWVRVVPVATRVLSKARWTYSLAGRRWRRRRW